MVAPLSPRHSPGLVASWRDQPFQTLTGAGRLLGLSRATLYKMAHRGDLRLKRMGCRKTVVETAEIVRLIEAVSDWTPSPHPAKATAARLRQSAEAHHA